MKTILIVEDTKDCARIFQIVLSRAGYGVVVAENGKMGLEKALQSKPDLILMDVMMPDQDGVETTIKIREQESLKDVPVVFLTAITAGENIAISVKGQDYPGISKMIDFKDFVVKIREYFKD